MAAELRALATIARWQNGMIAAIGVFVGAWWGARDVSRAATIAAALAAIALAAYANSFNDLLDIEIDRRAHPRRPLPSGALTPRTVRSFAIIAAGAGIAFAAIARPALGYLSVAVVALMTLYSVALARLPLIGNIVVALLASLPFFYGAVTVRAARVGLLLVGVAIPLHLARELAKSLDDAPADAPYRRTAPLVFGTRVTRALIVLAVMLFVWRMLVLVGPRPTLRNLMVPSLTLCALATARALAARTGAPLLFKTAMVAAMAALVVAR
ncbi:MAG TPA: UbiA family prenyltransferase [Gemmatimonadaceae bacterium]|nr:UbiA family prenyltransferase [Gemmatimonadaceae bacterium]